MYIYQTLIQNLKSYFLYVCRHSGHSAPLKFLRQNTVPQWPKLQYSNNIDLRKKDMRKIFSVDKTDDQDFIPWI